MSTTSRNLDALLEELAKSAPAPKPKGLSLPPNVRLAPSSVLRAVPVSNAEPEKLFRQQTESEIQLHKDVLQSIREDIADAGNSSTGVGRLKSRAVRLHGSLEILEQDLKDGFVPKHSATQVIATRQLFACHLFNIRGTNTPREQAVKFEFAQPSGESLIYRGPELRQLDSLVFMALVHMVRDIRVGTLVSFEPSEFCRHVFGYYEGGARLRLKETIHRLQQAILSFPNFTVQLAMRFSHPSRGAWSVMLDPDIVKLFAESPFVWLDLETRKSLPDGLATWLYGYIRSQSRLIPQKLEELRKMCGSEAKPTTFHTTLCSALNSLSEKGVIDPGWRVRSGVLSWRKLV